MSNDRQEYKEFCMDSVADKWSYLLLTSLVEQSSGFNQLLRNIDGISRKVLSRRLKILESGGLIMKQTFSTYPITVEYSITPVGLSFHEMQKSILAWADDHQSEIITAQKAYEEKMSYSSPARD